MSWQTIDLRDNSDEARYEGDPAELAGALADLLAELTARPEWHEQAACRGKGPDMFFIDRGGDTAPAKSICGGCVVRAECEEYAIGAGWSLEGVWAGLSPNQRKAVRRGSAMDDVA